MSKDRAKMKRADRAKQFMPFAALKGFYEALAEKERIVVEKTELTEDMADELNLKIRCIKEGDVVTITHYSDGEYIKTTGRVASLDYQRMQIRVVNMQISFEDIQSINL